VRAFPLTRVVATYPNGDQLPFTYAGVSVADIDDDGRVDIIVGQNDGHVLWSVSLVLVWACVDGAVVCIPACCVGGPLLFSRWLMCRFPPRR
jgi:hypothetical protein